jgi:hypothetical protein
MNVKIQLIFDGSSQEILLDEGQAAPITRSVYDLRSLGARRSAASKTLTASGRQADRVLGPVFDVSYESGIYSFDAYRRQRALLLEGDAVIMDGYVRLLQVSSVTDAQGRSERRTYELAMSDDAGDFFQQLGDLELADLDFTDLDHVLSSSQVISTIAHDWEDGYKYLWPQSDDDEYNLNEMQPGIFARQYWDRIFARAGYRYRWAGMDEDDVRFSRLIVPYAGNQPSLSPDDVAELSVDAQADNLEHASLPYSGDMTDWNENFVVDDEIRDPSGAYDPTTGNYDNPFYLSLNGIRTVYQFTITYSVKINNMEAGAIYLRRQDEGVLAAPGGFRLTPFLGFDVDGADSGYYSYLPPVTVQSGPGTSMLSLSPGDTTLGTYTQNISIALPTGTTNIDPGQLITNIIGSTAEQSTAFNTAHWSTSNAGTWNANSATLQMKIDIANIQMSIRPQISAIGFGTRIRMNRYVPKKVKQRDFVRSVCQMFNLLLEPDPDDERTIVVTSRDDYYDAGAARDWTAKLCYDLPRQVRRASLDLAKLTRLTYKQPNEQDLINQGYLDQSGDVYGELRFSSPDQNASGESAIEVVFEPSPIVQQTPNSSGWQGYVLPVSGIAPNTGIRIVYDGGSRNGLADYTIWDATGVVGYTGAEYNYAGHLDDPISPNFDLNFGPCEYYFYQTWSYVTNQNLYNMHWRRQLGQMSTGKVMSAYFSLTPLDMVLMKMNDKVFADGSWWNIVEVSDYQAGSGLPTKVTLITADDGIDLPRFRGRPTFKPGPGDLALDSVILLMDRVSRNRQPIDI